MVSDVWATLLSSVVWPVRFASGLRAVSVRSVLPVVPVLATLTVMFRSLMTVLAVLCIVLLCLSTYLRELLGWITLSLTLHGVFALVAVVSVVSNLC